MSNVNNYYGAVIIKDTVELRKLLMEHRPTSMELIYEWNRELTSLNISTANKYILPTPSAVKKIIVGAIKERLSNVKVAQSDNKETN